MKKEKGMINKIIFGIIGLMGFITLWQILVYTKNDPAIISIGKIAESFVQIITSAEFQNNLFSTLKIITIGIVISAVVGISCAVAMDLSENIRDILSPVIEILRNIPSITLFPILLVIYGIGDTARIFVIFWTATPPILISTAYGLKEIGKKSYMEASEIDGAGSIYAMAKIKLPLAFPEALSGIRIGIGSGFVAIVVAEMLGATKGIGYMVLWTTNAFKYSETYAYIIIIGVLGMAFNTIMQLAINIYEKEIGV